MKILLLLSVLFGVLFSHLAQASGDGLVRIGGYTNSILIWKTSGGSCYAVDLENVKRTVPKQWSSFFVILKNGFSPLRELTAEEESVCAGKVLPLRRWRVMSNGASLDRPVREIISGVELAVSLPRAPINKFALCSQSNASYHRLVYNNPPRAWRDFIIKGKRYVTLCVFR